MVRRILMVVVLGALGIAAARQPVASPIYYLSTAPSLQPGIPVTGVLSTESGRNFKDGSYVDVVVLRGEAGDFVELALTSGTFDTYLTLFAPDGSVVAANDDDWTGGGTDSTIRATLPATGTYVVVVSGYSEYDLGPYTLTLQGGAAGAAGGTVGVPETVSDTLAAGGVARYQVVLDEPTVLGVELRSGEFDTYLEVTTVDGWLLAENDDSGGTTDSSLVVRLDPGTYHVVVSSYGGWGGGAFELDLARYGRLP